MLQRGSFEKFHHDKGMAVLLPNFVDRANIRMIQGGGGTRFTAEPLECLRVGGDILGQEFQGDETTKLRVLGFVDHAHSTAAEFFYDAVVGDGTTYEGRGIAH